MPKEIVYSSEPFDESFRRCIAEVRWSRDSEYCQIATVIVEATDLSPIEDTVSGGWYVNLDRHGINDLVRNLRRARDQAFGRDE